MAVLDCQPRVFLTLISKFFTLIDVYKLREKLINGEIH